MLKRLGLPALVLAAASLLAPATALAEHRHERRGDPHFRVWVGPGPYPYGPACGGFYDRWGYWHPGYCYP
jgi:hypothetical protein